MARTRKTWSYTAGSRPYTVTVYERRPGGALYVRVWDKARRAGRGNWRRASLGHRDRERAKAYALAQAAKLRQGAEDLIAGRVNLAQVFTLYQRHRTPRKNGREQRADARRIEMWTRVLGSRKDPDKISLGEWEAFIDARRSGSIDARGKTRPEAKRHPVRARTVEADCNWLRWVFNWACRWRTAAGHYVMRENPVRGFDAPTEKNPRRPVATHDRFERIRAVSDEVVTETRWNGRRVRQRSHLSELLDIVNGTGRRITAVCALRYEDLRLDHGPYGAIRWPAETDKTARETLVPISPGARAAIDRVMKDRPGIGSAPLFPSPGDRGERMSRHLADKWLREGEGLAGLEAQHGSLWHAYRRKWATERKHLPDVDVAAAGGWKETRSLKRVYQQADQETMLRVVLEAGELREMR